VTDIIFDDGSRYQPTKIIGVGLNYADHIDEMNSIKPSEPVLFIKPSTALCNFTDPIILPDNMGPVHYELELAVCIERTCKNVTRDQAAENIAGFGMALDLTLREIQAKAKASGRPWAVAKGFDNSCPVSIFFKKSLSQMDQTEILFTLNNQEKQKTTTSLMLFKIDELIAYISGIFTLLPGDIILTGTPAGVGPLQSGDKIEGHIKGLISAKTTVL
jgi:2-keto-4-pentenoate hydratase/2-oxohepta-3-ene-1,7-dioic acid hydratase in catechol pathway